MSKTNPSLGNFESRHLGVTKSEVLSMCQTIGIESIDTLIEQTIPKTIRRASPMKLPHALSEEEYLSTVEKLFAKNKVGKSYIGQGYYGCYTPQVIKRNILENPGWYTAYTPYQAEISQGRLEALVNFQTTITDLTGMEITNASLLDEGTAAAEAMTMLYHKRDRHKRKAEKFVVDKHIFPQTWSVMKTRAEAIGIQLVKSDIYTDDLSNPDIYGVLIQYPNSQGAVIDLKDVIEKSKKNNVTVVVAADLLALCLLESPGHLGAEVVVGTTQRFGIPMGFGGPHAAYFATKEKYKRVMPGRIIGVSRDKNGNHAFRMALQTREQHIKREKATSNICTSQVLLAVMAGMYAVYHGPQGLERIARTIHQKAILLSDALQELGMDQLNEYFFDTVRFKVDHPEVVKKKAQEKLINFFYQDDIISISVDETTTINDIQDILSIFDPDNIDLPRTSLAKNECRLPAPLIRNDDYLTHDIFHQYHTEHELLRYIKRLENKDLSLVHSMISLGSCTMKLNATTEMVPLSWNAVANIHPFAPADQVSGYHELCRQLSEWIGEITELPGVSLQPNSGAQGEFAGLMVIKSYHQSRNETHRNITLIPSSAHGTNPASAVMAGMKIVIVKCDDHGNIDVTDLRQKAEQHADNLACLMITYPSTHGVFEEAITEICDIIHQYGGQVYMDGANMNAQVGITSPGAIGADVCHLNLHKTFCIPHGGGGPGMGPICVASHLIPFLPNHSVVPIKESIVSTTVSSAPYGSASILVISHAYIAMMGTQGLTRATKLAILNANYVKAKLSKAYKILYTGALGHCAHEMIVDFREFKNIDIDVTDVAKRLMDYGYHAPTISFPVPGTMMIEPTESESLDELDRFCNALLEIKKEIDHITFGTYSLDDNPLINAPHTIQEVCQDEWHHNYTRQTAAYPLDYLKTNKFWPSVARIDNAYGDRNLFCTCPTIESYEDVSIESV